MTQILRHVLVCATLVLTASAVSAQTVKTRIPGVTAELLELRVSRGVLRLGMRLLNTTSAPVGPIEVKLAQLVVTDTKTRTEISGLTDPAGRYLAGPVSDWAEGGRWSPRLAPNSAAMFWMYFPPVPAGTIMTVQVPKAFSFDKVKVTEGAGTLTTDRKAVSTEAGVTASVISVERQGQQLRVGMRLEPSAGSPGRAPAMEVLMAEVFAFDTVGQRKFMLMKGSDGAFMAEPMTDMGNGARLDLNTVSGPRPITFSFVAPPPDVMAVDIIIPGFVPIEGVKLAAGGGAVP